MSPTSFFINTVMICYNCSHYSSIRLRQGFRKISLVAQESEGLDIVMVACDECIANGAHKPMSSWLPKYVVTQDYRYVFRQISSMLAFTPNIALSIKFSVTAFRLKFCMRVYDIREIFNIPSVAPPSIRVFKGGKQIPNTCGFFTPPKFLPLSLCNRCLLKLDSPPAYAPDHTM
jgi:hypothetical protein